MKSLTLLATTEIKGTRLRLYRIAQNLPTCSKKLSLLMICFLLFGKSNQTQCKKRVSFTCQVLNLLSIGQTETVTFVLTTVFTNSVWRYGKTDNDNLHVICHELRRFWNHKLDNASWYYDPETDVIFAIKGESAFFALYKPGVEIDFFFDYFGKAVKDNLIKWKF